MDRVNFYPELLALELKTIDRSAASRRASAQRGSQLTVYPSYPFIGEHELALVIRAPQIVQMPGIGELRSFGLVATPARPVH